MIIPSTKKILIVPEFGGSADDMAMVALKEAIDADWNFNAKIVDLRQMVIDEHPGEELKDSKIIELAARKLEVLANDTSILWDKSDDCVDDPLFDRYLEDDELDDAGFDDEETIKVQGNDTPVDVKECEDLINKVLRRRLPIRKTVTNREELDADEPDVLVVFGKSVMLAGGVKDKPILFVDSVYDSEWPWKKQYYADRDAASNYIGRYIEELNKPEDTPLGGIGGASPSRTNDALRSVHRCR